MRNKICVAALACAFAAKAQDISISGTVTDASGTALQGAVVQLLGNRIQTVTDAAGHYSLTGQIGVAVRPGASGARAEIRPTAAGFSVSVPEAAHLRLQLFDLSGARVANVFDGALAAGRSDISVSAERYGRRCFILKAELDGTGSKQAGSEPAGVAQAGAASVSRLWVPGETGASMAFGAAARLRKVGAAAAADFDWIQAAKTGYASHVEKLSALTGTVDIVLGAPTQPDFGANVTIFDPTMKMSDMQTKLGSIKGQTDREFGSARAAILFKPGAYSLDVNVGFYMEVMGLGQSPDDVAITGAVRSKSEEGGDVLTNFWRAAGNLSVTPTTEPANVWAVSQAAPLRRVHIKGDLNLWDGGWSSGGFLADSKVDGQVNAGTQQQWISRNDNLGTWKTNPGSWNFVFVGVNGAPTTPWPGQPHTVVDTTPVIREKPFLVIDKSGGYYVMAPSLKQNSRGLGWANGPEAGDSLPIDQFYIAQAGKDNATTLNAALDKGLNLFLTPGGYHLSTSLNITRPNTVVLGIGMATLTPDNGTPAVSIADVDGVKFGGVILEAGANNSTTLLQVGEPGSAHRHADNPTSLHDVFCRVGGAAQGKASSCITINSQDIIVDHTWLWRADHGAGAAWNSNVCKNGLIVNGDNATIYGLFDEHHEEYQTLWNGNGGRLYFYQSEMPYDPPNQAAWMAGTEKGFASYKVADSVQTHEAWGLGVYSNFSDAPIIATNAVETPIGKPGVKVHHIMTLWLNGNSASQITHVIDGNGSAATQGSRSAKVTEQ